MGLSNDAVISESDSSAMGKPATCGDQASLQSSSSSESNSIPTDTSSASTVTSTRGTSSLFEESSKANNKTCQSPSLSSAGAEANSASSSLAVSVGSASTSGASNSANFLSGGSLGASTNFNSLSSSLTDGSQNKLAKSSNKICSSSGGTALFTGLGAKIPVISPSATAALEKHLKTLSVETSSGDVPSGSVCSSAATPTTANLSADTDNVIGNNNNNNSSKRNSRNMEGMNFLSCPPSAALPPIPPAATSASGNSNSFSLLGNKDPLFSGVSQAARTAKVSLPTKSSKQARLKSPSRRKSNVASPPPTVDDMLLGTGGISSCNHVTGGSSISGKSAKKKLSGKRYASSLPDRERCSATSPVAFDLNSFLCHNQGPIDFSGLLSRVQQQQQLLHQHQQASHHPSSHIIHHPQPTIPFMGHPKPTKHCKNKHMWARASIERDIVTGGSIPSPTPMSGPNICNNLSSSGMGVHAFTDKPACSAKLSSGSNVGMPPPNPSNRHSSYHPNYNIGPGTSIVGDPAAAAAAAAAAAYNAHILFSRPTSPLFLTDSASCCSEYNTCCPGCSAKTFPRVTRTGAHHGVCYCCHQNSSRNTNPSSHHASSRAQTATPTACDAMGGSAGVNQQSLSK